jgi:hypothetical protein
MTEASENNLVWRAVELAGERQTGLLHGYRASFTTGGMNALEQAGPRGAFVWRQKARGRSSCLPPLAYRRCSW